MDFTINYLDMVPEIIYALLVSVIIQWILFIFAFSFKTDKITDIGYGVGFLILIAAFAFMDGVSSHELILLAMIFAWGIRLSAYLLIRIRKMGRDRRFDGIRESFTKFLGFWTLQGMSIWIILLPALFATFNEFSLTALSVLGLMIWLLGFLIESMADYQKFIFKKKNKSRWIQHGIWKYSRHPNYFGEILCWAGIYIFVIDSLTVIQSMISLASPLYIAGILIFLTGIPKLEQSAEKKWGTLKEYKEYKKKTNLLIPWFPKK